MIKLHRKTSWLAYSTYLYFRLLYSKINLREHGKDMTHSQMLGKFEYTGGPIFKVVLEC